MSESKYPELFGTSEWYKELNEAFEKRQYRANLYFALAICSHLFTIYQPIDNYLLRAVVLQLARVRN